MNVHIVSESDNEVIIQLKIQLKTSMLESEQSILESINDVGTLATEVALKKFDADGDPIIIGDVKFTSRCQNGKNYQTPYGVAHINRHVYQTSKGGKVYVPLESGARIIQGATPRFAKILSHKYTTVFHHSLIEFQQLTSPSKINNLRLALQIEMLGIRPLTAKFETLYK